MKKPGRIGVKNKKRKKHTKKNGPRNTVRLAQIDTAGFCKEYKYWKENIDMEK